MKPRCPIHKRQLRWISWLGIWVCRIRPCKIVDENSPGPIKITQGKKRLRVVYRDGREVLSGEAWRERKIEVFLLDGGCCVDCSKFLTPPGKGLANEAEIHHSRRRGMAGSWRDDRIWITIDGKKVRNLLTLCWACHKKVTAKPEWSKRGL